MVATAKHIGPPVRANPKPPAGLIGWRDRLWLRLAVLVLVGGGFVFPLIVATIRHRATGQAFRVASDFLAAIQEMDEATLRESMTPTARARFDVADTPANPTALAGALSPRAT